MARTVATSGENDVDQLRDKIWTKLLPSEAASEFEAQHGNANTNPREELLSREDSNVPKKQKKRKLFSKSDRAEN